jgi:DNA-binding FadR family transcriptional regulator
MRDATDLGSFTRADVSFHQILADACHNIVLRHMIDVLRTSITDWVLRVARDLDTREAVCAEHAHILEAVAGRDAARARAAMDAHLRDVGERLVRMLANESDAEHLAQADSGYVARGASGR